MPDDVTPFRIEITPDAIDDLRDRLARTRWPEAEPVDDWSQGIPLGYTQDLCRYWAGEYDMDAAAARLNAFPQYRTTLDGLGIHFVHARSPHDDAFPLVMTHGWPGSIVEFSKVIAPLTDPTAHGGDAADAFHVVCPSLPGYGFSDKPERAGWNVDRVGHAWAELMARLGYERYGAQGGDWGATVTTCMGQHENEHLAGIHLNMPIAMPDVDGRPHRVGAAGARRPGELHGVGLGIREGAVHTTADGRLRPRRLPRRVVPRGSSRSSGRGPTPTAIPRTCSRATSCSTT